MIITSTHYNRPECTQKCIDHLSKCIGIDKYKVIFCVEPGCNEVLQIIKDCTLNKEIVENKSLLGCWVNKKQALQLAFEQNDCVLHIEDDILLSKDALLYFEWADKIYKNNSEIFSVTGYNFLKKEQFLNFACHQCHYNLGVFQVGRRTAYTPWAWMFWKDRWLEIPEWTGQDYHLNDLRKYRFEVFPILSRANNIGHISGSTSSKDILSTLFRLGEIDWFMEDCGISIADNLKSAEEKWKNLKLECLTNKEGREWIKLDDWHIKSRDSALYYISNYYLDFWANDFDITENLFFDWGYMTNGLHSGN